MRLSKLSVIALVGAVSALYCDSGAHQHDFELPGIVLWAWERAEDLHFINPAQTGVAFLAATALISTNGSVCFHPRTQSLLLPRNAAVIAVVRINSPLQHEVANTQTLISGLHDIAQLPNVRGIQIDFDARRSERTLYRTVLESMRIETAKPIGITALASWCAGDRWLDREPVVEAVPMFFRMGAGESRDMGVESPICRSSIGLSTDEPWPGRRPAGIGRIYLFSPRVWTQANYFGALHRVQDWK